MSIVTTQMRAEILEIPDAVERLLTEGSAAIMVAADKAQAADTTLPILLVQS